MFPLDTDGRSLVWVFCWQSTLFLGLGLAISARMAKRPEQAHRFLVIAMFVALVCTPLTQVVDFGKWALIVLSDGENSMSPLMPASSMYWAGLISVWLGLSVLASLRLVLGVMLAAIVVRRARVVKTEKLATAAAAAASQFGLGLVPELRVSARVRFPSIWCWSHRPVILLPQGVCAWSSVNWAGVFCHELAHYVRRDHWSCLLAEVLACVLPWHPLAWWCRHRIQLLMELASDDWALSTGVEAQDYAESLISIAWQCDAGIPRANAPVPNSVAARVHRILVLQRPVIGVLHI
jgi:beta-lactamase regulating signal transducer with metallopeptidase domain